MDLNIRIRGATITPNPVEVGKTYIISVQIDDIPIVLGDNTGALSAMDESLLETK